MASQVRQRSRRSPAVPGGPGTAKPAGTTKLAVPVGDRASGDRRHGHQRGSDRSPCLRDRSGQLALFSGLPADPRYDHVWRWGRPAKGLPPYNPQLKGRRCRVLCRGRGGGPRNVGVLLDGGELVCAPRWAVGRAT
jgi:hypothetical protein